MLKGNAGLLALCILLGGAAFAVLFVAPSYFRDEARMPEPIVAESDASSSAAGGEADENAAIDGSGVTDHEGGDAAGTVAEEAVEGSQAARQAGQERATAAGGAGEAGGADAASQETAAPAFDVLRVEPDGSTVVAGRAEPGTELEILNKGDVIARTKVGPSGDFATVFDKPLAPGNHQLRLRANASGKAPVMSDEVATISIPADREGELLAMVTRPGKASRIISTPGGGEDTASAAKAEAAATPLPGAPASEEDDRMPDAQAASAAAGTDEDPDEDSAMSGEGGTEAVEMAEAGDLDGPAVEMRPAQTKDIAATPSVVEEGNDAARVDEPSGDARDGNSEAETASLADEGTASTSPETTTAQVRIDAVEVEGDQFYVTGSAVPGSAVRLYADGSLVGETAVTGEGRFLVEERFPLSVGEHQIRADMILGGKVMARALVPFFRPETEAAAAIARAAGNENADETPTERIEAATQPDGGTGAEGETSESPDGRAAQVTAMAAPDAGEPSAGRARPAAEPETAAGGSDAMATKGHDGATAADGNAARKSGRASGEDVSELAEAGAPAAQDSQEIVREDDRPASEIDPREADEVIPADKDVAVAMTRVQESDSVTTFRQQPLQPSESSVIIRRGDTLWQISRRVYGKGIRYTTIYLANDDQIANPDLILPGQVFSLPEEALANSAELHRQRMQNR